MFIYSDSQVVMVTGENAAKNTVGRARWESLLSWQWWRFSYRAIVTFLQAELNREVRLRLTELLHRLLQGADVHVQGHLQTHTVRLKEKNLLKDLLQSFLSPPDTSTGVGKERLGMFRLYWFDLEWLLCETVFTWIPWTGHAHLCHSSLSFF